MEVHDLTGKKFGRLTVLYRNGSNKNGRALWAVACDCGQNKTVLGNALTTGNTLSCGCLQKEKAKDSMKTLHKNQWSDSTFVDYMKNSMREKFTTHGARNRDNPVQLYDRWHAMKTRCNTIKSYKRKHITVYAPWAESYVCFREWALNNGYKIGLELDRIDNNKNYTPDNCQFLSSVDHYKKTGIENKIRLGGKNE